MIVLTICFSRHSISLQNNISQGFSWPIGCLCCFGMDCEGCYFGVLGGASGATFLPIPPPGFLGGGGSKILCCCCGGRVEYRGMILMSPTSGPRSSTSRLIRLHASSISWSGMENISSVVLKPLWPAPSFQTKQIMPPVPTMSSGKKKYYCPHI